MGCISLSDMSQFLEELRRDRLIVERRLVRMVEVENEGFWSSDVQRKHLIVTARVGQDILRLDQFYSPPSGNQEHDSLLAQTMSSHLAQLQETCQELGIEIRHGVLEEGVAVG